MGIMLVWYVEWGQACILTYNYLTLHNDDMARKPRIEFPGAFYQVISRGNQRKNIFYDKSDHQAYLNRFEHYRKKYQVTVYAFVLMSNHIHLLIETQDTPLSKFMQGLVARS